jgi:hypothetical protein
MQVAAHKSGLFENVPPDVLHLFEGSRPNAKKVVDLLHYRKEDVSVAANLPVTSVRYDGKMPKELLELFTQWALALNLVGSFFKDPEKTEMWFQIPNPLLGNLSPSEMIRIGRFKKLYRFIQTALEENQR